MPYDNILKAVTGTSWAIAPEKLDAMMAVLDLRVRGLRVDPVIVAEVTAAARKDRALRRAGEVAVLPILGVLSQRADIFTEASGFGSTDAIGREFDKLVADTDTSAIVLDVDSPGGTVAGVQELADKIFTARGSKPIVAVANAEAASTAYWIATAADEVVVTPSGQVGSVGVMAVHLDRSAANEKDGLNPTYITYGERKAELAEDKPLSDEARAQAQQIVDSYGREFEASLARNRGVTASVVRADFGQGRMFRAGEAVKRGMADRVATLEETVTRLQSGSFRRPRRAARAAQNRLTLLKHGGRLPENCP